MIGEGMTEHQAEQLLALLRVISSRIVEDRPYTLIGAVDWYWVPILCGAVAGLLIIIWNDLKKSNEKNASLMMSLLAEEKKERKESDVSIFECIERCQDGCCTDKVKTVTR